MIYFLFLPYAEFAKMNGPLFNARLKAALRLGLRAKHGLGFREINDVLAGMSDDDVQLAAQMTAKKMNQEIPQAGDTPILDFLTNFFNSPFGQQLLQVLMQLLLGLIAA